MISLEALFNIIKYSNRRYLIHNLLSYAKKNGVFVCTNGFVLRFNEKNYKYIRSLFYFLTINGVNLSNRPGNWNYEDDIIITPDGIKFC